jgi:hypothetical protein
MKQKLYTLGLVVALIVFIGAIFKVNHFPGAGILLTVGLLSLVLLFLPAALSNHYKSTEGKNNLMLYIVTWLTSFILFVSMLFKIMHWPHAGLLLIIALPFPYVVFLPVFLAVTSKNKNFNVYNTVFVLLLLALNSVFSGMLALNPSKNIIDDSYNISRNYNRSYRIISDSDMHFDSTSVNNKIDEVIGVIDKTQASILKFQEENPSEWIEDAGGLKYPDRWLDSGMTISSAETTPGLMLAKSLRELINLVGHTPGYEVLAENIAGITDFTFPEGKEEYWAERVFQGNTRSWTLIYLDGLRANLLMIKAAKPAGLIAGS